MTSSAARGAWRQEARGRERALLGEQACLPSERRPWDEASLQGPLFRVIGLNHAKEGGRRALTPPQLAEKGAQGRHFEVQGRKGAAQA